MLVAGESSGDALGGELAAQLKKHRPKLRLCGVGGEKMHVAGVDCFADSGILSAMGYWDVMLRLPAIISLRRRVLAEIKKNPPTLFVGIDTPEFNLSIASYARHRGAKTVQYVSPSLWAWRRERIKKIERVIHEVWCLLPFEPHCYEKSATRARFVGHPEATRERIQRAAARRQFGFSDTVQIVALFPGSRRTELHAHLPLLAQTVALMRAENRLFVAVATDEEAAALMRKKLPMVKVKIDCAPQVLAAADVALVKSGTVTLQAALAQTPMVIFYRPSWMASLLVRHRRFYLPFSGLPNILCGRFVAPEFIFENASPMKLAQAGLHLLQDKTASSDMSAAFSSIRQRLLSDTSAATAALDLLS